MGLLYQSSAPHGYNGGEPKLSILAADMELQNNTLCGLWNDRDRRKQRSGMATAVGVEPYTCLKSTGTSTADSNTETQHTASKRTKTDVKPTAEISCVLTMSSRSRFVLQKLATVKLI